MAALAVLFAALTAQAGPQPPQFPPGTILSVAGIGEADFSGDGGPATRAALDNPFFLAVDGTGNLFIGDAYNERVRRVRPDGTITTVAGGGQLEGSAGDGGPATGVFLKETPAVAVDATGNLFFGHDATATPGNGWLVRKVDAAGIITTVAGGGDPADGLGDGGPATAAKLRVANALAVDAMGHLFISDQGNHTVPKVDAAGVITTVAGNGVYAFSGDGGPAMAASLAGPLGVAADTAGNLFIADLDSYRVRKVDANGIINTVAGTGLNPYAGDGVLATATGLRGPAGAAVDAAGNLLFSDTEQIGHEADGLGYNERVLKVFGVAAPGLLAGMPFPKPQ
jgi:hypothetical protein